MSVSRVIPLHHALSNSKYRYMELSLQQRRKALGTKIPDIEQTLNVVRYLQLRRRKAAGEPIEEEEENEDDEDDLDEEEGEGKEDKLKTLFELNDTLYAEAEVDETGQVGLWLGVSWTGLLLLPAPPPPYTLEPPAQIASEWGRAKASAASMCHCRLASSKYRSLTLQANTMLLYPLQEAIDLLAAKLASAKKSLEETIEDLEWLREQVTVMEVNFARVHNVRCPSALADNFLGLESIADAQWDVKRCAARTSGSTSFV